MDAPEAPCPAAPSGDQRAPAPGPPAAWASPRPSLGAVQPPGPQGQGPPPTVFLKALPVPLRGPGPRAPLVAGGVDGARVPLILSALRPPERPGPAPTLTVSIVGALPVLPAGPGPSPGQPGRPRGAGRHLCPHCGRDCLKPSVLEKHIRSHTGERPFPCATCHTAFKTQSNLYKHRRTQTHRNNSRLSLEAEGAGDRAAEASLGSAPSPGAPPCPSGPRTPAAPGPGPQTPPPGPPRRPPEGPAGALRKCESSDSGYLSRSDSAEQPSPLRSPGGGEGQGEGQGEGEGRPGPSGAGPGAGLELEKKRLGERIARLISHNQAVVGDPQLGPVRPRRSVLSSPGSADLPTPRGSEGSFRFDFRARAALRPARSTLTPLDKSRPLFFHSVPTQLSTTVECVPVTRSNSLPFLEASGTWPAPRGLQDTGPRTQKQRGPRPIPARPGSRSGLALPDVPAGHPRALVRQAAVEDLPGTPTGDAPAPSEDPGGKRGAPGEGAPCQGRAPAKKGGPRRLKMFSQDKWRVYGSETFQRIYQKGKGSPQAGQKARELRGSRDRPDLPPQEKAAGCRETAPSQHARTPSPRDTPQEAKSGVWGGPPAPEGSLYTEPPTQAETVAAARCSGLPEVARAACSPALGPRDPSCLSSGSPLRPPDGGLKTAWQGPPTPGPLGEGDQGPPGRVPPDPRLETGIPGVGGTKEPGLCALAVLRRPSRGSGGPWAAEHKLPSGRKRPKVEGLGPQETPGGPTQTAPAPPQKQDGHPGERPGRPYGSAEPVARALESSDTPGAPAASLGPPGPDDKEPVLPPATKAPGHHGRAAAQPGAPSILRAPAEGTFPPKYLLRVPQGEAPPVLPVTQGPGQGPESLCLSVTPGPPESPSPAPGGTDGIPECPGWSRQRDGRKEPQVGREEGEGTTAGTLVAPGDTASFPCVPQSTGGKSHATHQPGTGTELAGPGPSGGVPSLWAPHWALGGPPEKAPERLPSEPAAGCRPCSPFLVALAGPQAQPAPAPAPAPLAEPPRSGGAPSSFPSLRAEPRLTWCCLGRSRPLPADQQEKKAASVCLGPHVPAGSFWDAGPDTQPSSHRGRTRTGPGEGGLALTPKIAYPAAPGMKPQGRASDPARKKGLSPRRVKASRGSSKQKRLRVNPKRYEGTFWQSRGPLRASRLRKPLWVPRRSCPLPPHWGPEPRETRKLTGLSLQGEPSCTTSKLSLGSGSEEKEEGDSSPSSSSRTATELDTFPAKVTCPSAAGHSDCPPHHDTASVPGSRSCMAPAGAAPSPLSEGLPAGLPQTLPLPSPGPATVDPTPRISSDLAQEPSSFGSQRTFPRHDTATAAAAISVSLGAEAGHSTLGTPRADPPDHSGAAGKTLAPGSPAERASAGHCSPTDPPGSRLSGPAPSGSTGKTPLETPASGPSPASPPQEGGGHQAGSSSRGQPECGEMAPARLPLGNANEKRQASGLITPKGREAPLSPGKPAAVPTAPSRSIRKRSLEGMRKQTRVELSDTSSDDEDRLVIEI